MLSELDILKYWDDNKIFAKSISQKDPANNFSFYDGPPFATGLPHYGHILASTIKDVIPRFWTMRGKRIERRWGWDCHGLPVENIVEQKLKLKTRKDILAFGVDKFNEECRSCVLQYVSEWKKTIHRLGRWVDMENDYKTMNLEYMESIWWVFKSLWDKGLIYEGRKSMHICPRCETALSNFEVTQGYKDITDLSATMIFKITSGKHTGKYLSAWTTTPWTLAGNVLLAINPNAHYIWGTTTLNGVPKNIIIAKERTSQLAELDITWNEAADITSAELVNSTYEPLFPLWKDNANAFRIVAADFVSLEDGTGVVHIAPAFGEDDMNCGLKEKVDPITHVQMNGLFVPEVVEFLAGHGFDVKDKSVKPIGDPSAMDKIIVEYLTREGKILFPQPFTHSYPHCWRCETPLLNYTTASWFVRVTELKEKLLTNNELTNWVPDHIKEGRFGKWLEGARDWAISRSRYWGTPLPIWRAEDGDMICIGSCQELEELSGSKVTDLHKHLIDGLEIKKDGKTYKRIPEVLDCWFESGSMPYAQTHYPFEHQEEFTQGFPTEFIGEGQDQTRGWFYTLHVLATALFDKPAFKNVIVNGIVLAEDGKKMSKRLKNYPEPDIVIDKYGADALRMYLCLSPAMEAENLCFSEQGVKEIFQKVNMITQNVLKFWELYAPQENDPSPLNAPKSSNALDLWIYHRARVASERVTKSLETYHIPASSREIVDFIQDLSTWYLRRSRDRFKGEDVIDKTQAIKTLGWVLRQTAMLLSPFMPMLAETVYLSLKGNKQESVHLTDWQTLPKDWLNTNGQMILDQMIEVRNICSNAHTLRAEKGIKIRQPLAKLTIKTKLPQELLEIISDETNVKEVTIDSNITPPLELDTNLSDELLIEGEKRELIRNINGLRKKIGLTINDRAIILVDTDNPETMQLLESWKTDLLSATLCTEIKFEKINDLNNAITILIKEQETKLTLNRLTS